MNSKTIFFGFLLLIISEIGFCQNNQPEIRLFVNRQSYISGDTVWFKVWNKNENESDENIIHTQLSSATNHVITQSIQQSNNNWAEGYLHVPDSLSSGVYFLTAFTNSQRCRQNLKLETQLLYVYNRFENDLFQIVQPRPKQQPVSEINTEKISILIPKTSFSTRENVNVKVDFSELNDVENVVVCANLVDPLADNSPGCFVFDYRSVSPEIPTIAENNAFVVSGYVQNDQNHREPGKLVLLSIPNEPPYFDYCVTDSGGNFQFLLNNLRGIAEGVLQVENAQNNPMQIIIQQNELHLTNTPELSETILTSEQNRFISNALNANYLNKIFNPAFLFTEKGFTMPHSFSIPFFGPVTKHIIPDEFIDLPDFREISRELLPGLQYRIRNDKITFRTVNLTQGNIFNNEPLRLINGIPVFNNDLFANLKSTDIKYVDLVQNERIFGDLMFKGVLSVSLNDKSNTWLNACANAQQIQIIGIQSGKQNTFKKPQKTGAHLPDIRSCFLWELSEKSQSEFEFQLSDLKGRVEISVEGIRGNERFKVSKIIEVK